MPAQVFEFSDKEIIDVLVDRLVGQKLLPKEDFVFRITAERTGRLGGKGFKVSLRVTTTEPA